MTAKILCIDDEPGLREDIVEELRDAGYETVEAGDGRAGLEAIIAQKPDLVLCDITMPVMDAHSLLKELRDKHPDQADLPFIFLSALADRDHVIVGKRLGADDYLTKPIDFELLLATVEARLGQIQRMETRKQAQLVKVFKAASQAAAAAAPAQAPGTAPDTAPDAAPSAGGDPAGGPDRARRAVSGAELRGSLSRFAAQASGKVVAGRLQMVGLDEIKAKLGERWQSHAKKVFDIAERVIERRISAQDVFSRDEKNNFVICFASLKEEEAAFKAKSIAEEIRSKVLGHDDDEDWQAFCDEASAISSEAYEIEVSPEEIEESEDVLDLLLGGLEKAASRARNAEATTLAQICKSCAIELRPVVGRARGASSLAFCEFDGETGLRVRNLLGGRPLSSELAAELDNLMFAKAAEALFAQPAEGASVLIVSVSFSTLDNKRSLERYRRLCTSLTDAAKANVVFNVGKVPPDFLPAKVVFTVNNLRPYCRAIMVQLSSPELGNIDPAALQVPLLSCAYADLHQTLQENPKRLSALIEKLKRTKAKLLVHGVASDEDRRKLLSLGIDYTA